VLGDYKDIQYLRVVFEESKVIHEVMSYDKEKPHIKRNVREVAHTVLVVFEVYPHH
jgi:hypothetical protein